jgi:DNA-directed RNA polymerase specialized sigma24 family protein
VYATVKEVLEALERLEPADHLRLQQFARIAMYGSPFATPAELVADAVTTAYLAAAKAGGRRWRSDVPFMSYLVMTMRGLASDARRMIRHRAQKESGEVQDDEHDGRFASQLFTPSIEQLCTEAQDENRYDQIEAVRTLFKGDPPILGIIEGIEAGMTPQEIRTRAGMTETEYESARRRMRRAFERLRKVLASRKDTS